MASSVGRAYARPFFVALAVALAACSEVEAQESDSSAALPGIPITCVDVRTGNPFTHFARHITSGGLRDTAWTPSPTATCLGSLAQVRRALASDGAGGTYVAWVDTKDGDADIALQRLGSDGLPVSGWPNAGVVVADGPATQDDVSILAGGGGVYVLWHQLGRTTAGDIRLQRFTPIGEVAAGWPPLGKVVCGEAHDQAGPRLAPDGTGGVLIAWQDRRRGVLGLYASRIDSAGAVLEGWGESGSPLASLSGNAEAPTLASASSNALLAWRQAEPGVSSRMMSLAIPVGSTVGPPNNPTTFEIASGADLSDPSLAADSAGFVLAWGQRGVSGSVRAQHLQVSGGSVATGWTGGGIEVGGEMPSLTAPQMTADGAGGQLIAWEELGGEDGDVYIQRLTAAGAVAEGWSSSGTAVSTEDGEQYAPVVAADGSGGAIVTWSDGAQEESGGFYTLTASGMRLEVRLLRAKAIPGKAKVVWQALLPQVDGLRVDRQVGQEAWAELGPATVGDSSQVVLEDKTAPEGAEVSYRLVAMLDGTSYHFRPIALRIPIAPPRLELHWIRASGPRGITLSCAIPHGGTPSLEVFDVQGRRMMERTLELEPGEHTVNITTPSRMRSGVYFVRLRQDREVRQAKLVFVR